MADIIVAGGGPAGLSAAIYAMRSGHSATVIERLASGGQVAVASMIENYPGFQKIPGYELATELEEHARAAGAEIVYEEITGFELAGGIKRTVTHKNEYESRAIVLAMGANRRHLDIPGEKELTGRGVSYCATCDGAFFRKKDVAVIGGGNSAVGDAIYLSNVCDEVYLIHRRDEFRAEKYLQQQLLAIKNIRIIYDAAVERISGENSVHEIEIRDMKTGEARSIPVSGVFVAIGTRPQTDLVSGMLTLDGDGYIPAPESCKTEIRGVFAAGDIRAKPLRQLTTAVSDGANAIHSALELF